jgi:serine/threonine protein kinase
MSKGIEPDGVLPIFSQILDGVESAHPQGVWHRDLKPENILYSLANGTLIVADFGIAHFEEQDLLTAVETQPNERLANFLYAAPEQKIRAKSADSRSDIYALGLMLHEMFTGDVPLGTRTSGSAVEPRRLRTRTVVLVL